VPAITIDADVKDEVLQNYWSMGGFRAKYPKAMIGRKMFLLHRFIWGLKREKLPAIIDHIDCNPLNATMANLREATPSLSARNKWLGWGKYLPGTKKRGQRWQSAIRINYKTIHLGSFASEFEAHAAYMSERSKLLAA
jgi:hypothetical protein